MITCFILNSMCLLKVDLSFKIKFCATCLYNLALYDESLFTTYSCDLVSSL
jgi:hypothetical protein